MGVCYASPVQAIVAQRALVVIVMGGCAEPAVQEPDPPADQALCDRAAYLVTTPAGEQLSLEQLDELARACDWCPAGREPFCNGGMLFELGQAEFEASGRRLAVSLGWGDVDRAMARIEELGARLACSDEATLREARALGEAGEAFSPSCFHVDFPPGTCGEDAHREFGTMYSYPWLPPTADPCSCEPTRCERP